MTILTIIPILNPPQEFFTNTIAKLNSQTISHKVVLINSGAPMPECEAYRVINIDKREFNHANTRNMALQFPADFYLFMTQDAAPYDNKMLENLLKGFQTKDIVISYARQIPYSDAHITEKFARETNYPQNTFIKSKEDIKTLGIKTYFTSDSCALYKADYFEEANGFKKDLNASEDMEFAARAIWDNKKIAYTADAKVYHSHIYTIKTLFKRYLLIGKFFKQNQWIEDSIKEFVTTEKTGLKQILAEYKYILKTQPLGIFRSFIFTLVKYLGYKIGKKF